LKKKKRKEYDRFCWVGSVVWWRVRDSEVLLLLLRRAGGVSECVCVCVCVRVIARAMVGFPEKTGLLERCSAVAW